MSAINLTAAEAMKLAPVYAAVLRLRQTLPGSRERAVEYIEGQLRDLESGRLDRDLAAKSISWILAQDVFYEQTAILADLLGIANPHLTDTSPTPPLAGKAVQA